MRGRRFRLVSPDSKVHARTVIDSVASLSLKGAASEEGRECPNGKVFVIQAAEIEVVEL